MTRYYCNCCGCDFSESEGEEYAELIRSDATIVCPVCDAAYDEDDETIIERYEE